MGRDWMENKEHDCIHEEDFNKIYTLIKQRDQKDEQRDQKETQFYSDMEKRDTKIYEAFTEIQTGLREKGILNGVRDDKIKEIEKERKDGDQTLSDKVDDLKDLLIKFIIAIITLLGVFIASILYILFEHIIGKF